MAIAEEAKARIRAMEYRYVEERKQNRQALLEIYCAVVLGTPYCAPPYAGGGRLNVDIAGFALRASATEPGRVKTKTDLVIMPSGGRIFAFIFSARDHRPQNSGCSHTA
jgi:hypothetical protein